MKLNKIKISVFLIKVVFVTIIAFNFACDDTFIDGSNTQERYVTVNAFLSPQDSFRLNISLSESVETMQKDSFINNANIVLTLPDNSKLQLIPDLNKYRHFQVIQQGYYRLEQVIPFQSGNYELSVNIPGFETIIARDSIPTPVPIDNCSFSPDSVSDNSFFILEFSDPPETENFYSVSLNVYYFYSTFIYNSDSIGGVYYINVIDSIYNTYISSTNSFIEASIPGGLRQILFSDRNIPHSPDKTVVRMKLDLTPNYSNYDSIVFKPQLNSISKAYYNYSINYFKQNLAEKDFYADPVRVYSNVQGGYGIFAGFSTSEKKIVYCKGEVYK